MIKLLSTTIMVSLLLIGCYHRPIAPGPIMEIDEHTARLTVGVPFTPQRNGYFLSDELLDKLLERLELLQKQLDGMPKTNIPAEAGRPPDNSARLFGSMANNPDGDYHYPSRATRPKRWAGVLHRTALLSAGPRKCAEPGE